MPSFFVPHIDPEKHEEIYAELAQIAQRAVPLAGSRIYSITFRHNGETWTATVGETLKGTRIHTKGRGRTRIEREVPVRDGSTVMAIFPGVPFMVWHDGASRHWTNPFMAGEPSSITYFTS